MSKLILELETQKENALAMARYFDNQIEALGKPKKKPDIKLVAVKAQRERKKMKRYG